MATFQCLILNNVNIRFLDAISSFEIHIGVSQSLSYKTIIQGNQGNQGNQRYSRKSKVIKVIKIIKVINGIKIIKINRLIKKTIKLIKIIKVIKVREGFNKKKNIFF